VTLQVGATQQFTANVPVTWSATCGTITGSGLYTAPHPAPGATLTCTITATPSNGNPVTITITIKSTPPAVVISPSAVTLVEGQNVHLTANVDVTWSATCGTINDFGLYTAPSKIGSCTVTATAKDGSGFGTCAVTVTSGGVTISPTAVTLKIGTQQQFTASAAATWTATCGRIDNSGLYTAPGVPQTCTIVATATDGSNSQATATATVIAPPLMVSPSSVTLLFGASQQFTASQPAAWSASCGTIDNKGLYRAPSTAGTCVVTATATDGTGSHGTATVRVVPSPPPQVSYTTWKNDNMRTGQQRQETVLSPGNVNAAQFGIKFSDSVDGAIYAQPLYVSNLSIAGGVHNVVFVATEHDSVYAFDANTGGGPLWFRNLIPDGTSTVPTNNVHSTVYPEVGITGTPVIDMSSGTLYVVAETMEGPLPSYVFRLYALDIHSGNDRTGSPVVVSAAGFVSTFLMQRPALLLASNLVYITFGSQGDLQPGWIFAYDPASLGQVAAWIDTPTGNFGGIWMSGSGLAADSAGNVYVSTGNGDWDGFNNFSMSLVKLDPTLHVLDYFTPWNWQSLAAVDKDLGSGGVLLVPDQPGIFTHELVACGKPSPVYVIDRDNMGHMNPTGDTQVIQALSEVVGAGPGTQAHCFTTPAFWEQNLYFVGIGDVIKAFHLDPQTGKMTASPTSQGTFVYPYPGAQPVVSSDGANNGIVWAVDYSTPTVLHAYDATDISRELYVSPSLGVGTKWSVPTVINGNVYVGTGNQLFVFGLN
jgi:hypothetical protein